MPATSRTAPRRSVRPHHSLGSPHVTRSVTEARAQIEEKNDGNEEE